MKKTGKFLSHPGLIPLPDGSDWAMAGELRFQLPDGRIITVPCGFKTDLASIPPLGVVGGSLMAIAYALAIFCTSWADLLILVGFLICLASAYLKAYGKYTYSAVLHDWLFRTHLLPFTECNKVLLVAMRSENTAPWERFLIWFNVQAFGYGIYRSDKRQRSVNHHHPKSIA
jgi:hypothetical protein